MTMTMTNTMHPRLPRAAGNLLVALGIALLATLVWAGSARAALEFEKAGAAFNEPPALNPDGSPQVKSDGTFVAPAFNRQAGSHPDISVSFELPTGPDNLPIESPKDIEVDLPLGFVGNPNGIPT